jgi:hypothetical protein
VVTGSDSIGLRSLVARCCEDATFSEMADAEMAESCTIPLRGHGVVLSAKVRDEQAMRIVHEILCAFGAPLTEKDHSSTCRLVSIGISSADPIKMRSSRVPEASTHTVGAGSV